MSSDRAESGVPAGSRDGDNHHPSSTATNNTTTQPTGSPREPQPSSHSATVSSSHPEPPVESTTPTTTATPVDSENQNQTQTQTQNNAHQDTQTATDPKMVDGGKCDPTAAAPPTDVAAVAALSQTNTDLKPESEEPKVTATSGIPAAQQSTTDVTDEDQGAEGEGDATGGKEVVEENAGPSLVITLLLITGTRHPFKIDAKYLRKQSVNVENHDPFLMSVYTLKELIWREWRSDWEPRPTSPSSIRLISFGKLLEDKAPLSESKFSRDAPNVIHMTVKPQEIVDEEDAKGTKTHYNREREASERSPGCRCVIL